MKITEDTIKSEMIYQGKIINLRKDTVKLINGNQSQREVIEHPGGVTVIAVTEQRKILLVEQYRKPAEKTLFELPAGKLEKGEDPQKCAERELIEETGYRAGKIKKVFSFYTTPGFSDEVLYLYLADELEEVGINPDENEILIKHEIDKNDILKYIKSGKIEDAKSIIGLLAFLSGEFGFSDNNV